MKILVFSDTHLNLPFEEKKFKFLESIIKDVDKVIINGDFWEGYQITFEQFIESPWKQLFSLLKDKKTIYLFGNHDKQNLSDKRVSLFSDFQVKRYTQRLNGNRVIFEHGNRLLPFFDERLNLKKGLPIVGKIVKKTFRFMIKRYGKKFLPVILESFNRKIKYKIKSELKKNEILICGHTHLADFDIDNKFINSGFIDHGLGQYLLIEDEKVILKEEWYE